MSKLQTETEALAVVRREARLRQGETYLTMTKPYVQAGQVPPVELDQQMQAEALKQEGYSADAATVERYQTLVRSLPLNVREQIFFLNANDRFFHPEVDAIGMFIAGDAVFLDGTLTKLDSWLAAARAMKCTKLFLLASTST